jgi:hypothetical protein
MNRPADTAAYVRHALLLQGYEGDDAFLQDVTVEFERLRDMAQRLDAPQLPHTLQPAPEFTP